ncbi:MAG: guanosine 5'-monophosphate oxidoreductase [Erysipelothrix sp.]
MILKPLYDNSEVSESLIEHPIVSNLVNVSLGELDKKRFITFPQQLSDSSDLEDDNYIFQHSNGKVRTCNIVGILSHSGDELRINSRFTNKENQEDFFLRYMIQKVLNYNVIESEISTSEEFSYYDLLIFLFPYYLNEAMRKGLYKEYVRNEYNDANIKGAIDFNRHIKNNVPFHGAVSYNSREFSYDNKITQLIRHTIEKIGNEHEFLLTCDDNTINNVRDIRQVTSRYKKTDRLDVIENNLINPVKHGYYEEYSDLQRICIQILSESKSGFGNNDNQVNGVIIDVAWLWEEYIWKVTQWKHYGKRPDLETLRLFKGLNGGLRYPDFSIKNIPIDTKYKINIDTRNDYNQVITYMYVMNSNTDVRIKGGFLQPTSDINPKNHGYEKIGELNGIGGELFKYRFFVPQNVKTYVDFVNEISISESKLVSIEL